MKNYLLTFMATISIIASSCNSGNHPSPSNFSDSNPFAKESTLPFHTFDFSKLHNSDFAPAFDEGMKEQLEEVKKIIDNNEAASFENTLTALEKSGQLLQRARSVFNLLTGANTNDTLQKLDEEYAPKFAAQSDAIYLDNKLFKRVESVYNQRPQLKLDPESLRLTEYYYQQFVKAGAKLSDADKEQLKKMNSEEASLSSKFNNQLLNASKNGAVVIDNKAELDGMSSSDLEAAAAKAKADGKDNQWKLPLQNTTQQPYLQSLKNRETRKKIFEASWTRTEKNDANDTRKTISRLAQLRAQKAKLLGFPSYAAWNLQNQMAKTPEAVFNFLNHLIPPTVQKGKEEAADIQKLIQSQGDTFHLEAWDWNYYSEQVRKAKYDLDENEIKPYFVLDSVLQNGVFYAANQLYGITFKERNDLPVYQNDVKVFEVFDKDGSSLALFYCDYFKRDNKNGGAWMSNIVHQSTLLGYKPVVYNVCNFTKPAQGQPALISFEDVTTMFHEFGHALHGMFASQKYPSLSGTSTSRDFVEFPSQFNEHWALYPTILKNYAKHYKTGEVIPQTLIDKIKNASTFNQGYAFGEYLAAAGLDMEWHTLSADEKEQNTDSFETLSLKKLGTDLSYIPPRYRSSYFLHIWANGYSAGYYAYCWSEMLDDDAFAWFEEHGGLSRENGQYFRDKILSRGNSEDLATLYRGFRGHDPGIDPLLKNRGLKD
ncbi:MAG: peptidyl-dipeptidase Dcp [Arachidicoccus sp.]|nr:peptidyl-dipeptidase Dcp [Arachidicoccus sp.]